MNFQSSLQTLPFNYDARISRRNSIAREHEMNRSDTLSQIHFRESYSRMKDLTEQYDKMIDMLQDTSTKVLSSMRIRGDFSREKPKFRDYSWSCYGSLPIDITEEIESLEEEIRCVISDIAKYAGSPLPKSSLLSLNYRAIDIEGYEDPHLYIFYSLKSLENFMKD